MGLTILASLFFTLSSFEVPYGLFILPRLQFRIDRLRV